MNPFGKFQSRSNRYEKLNTNELEYPEQVRSCRLEKYHWVHVFVLLCSIAFFALGSVAFYVAGSYDSRTPSEWSTPGFAKFARRNIKFVGSFESATPYRGDPSPEIDAAWARFTTSHWADGTAVVLGVGAEEIRAAGKDKEEEWFNSTVQLGDANGGGMMATLEMFHQLHCLDLVRKFTFHKYPYYKNSGGVFSRPIEVQKNHIDHCLEIIRQVVMCNGDTGLITFHWVEENRAPYPDFNTLHACKDPEEILALAKEREAPMRQQVTKTQGIINMPTPP
ncbi:hypothetical protein F5Y10DRAFT_271146 [Nemania abortiva]|nr:hypothetical protein F5Y10DRAFT_271146 [Nemania abortiva]